MRRVLQGSFGSYTDRNGSSTRSLPLAALNRFFAILVATPHRVAISNHRLVSFDGNQVSFRWKDYAHGNKKRKMTLSAEEFIRRFLLHVLPKGFVRIRHFGFMANHQRSASLELCRQLLDMAPIVRCSETTSTTSARLCPACHGPITVIEKLNPA